MRVRFSKSFKIQAVEKALNRSNTTILKEVADSLGVGRSTLDKWIVKSRNREFETVSSNERDKMTQEKRPQDWSLEERLNMIIACGSLDTEASNELCRERGIYPHHVNQWKLDFASGQTGSARATKPSEAKELKSEIKTLKKELNRKDRALAETAALLVLQKKVSEIWGSDEDS